jgi:aspartate aminotransferase
MTCGAAGAINTVLKSVLDPGDEAIVLAPYFPEYRFYIENHAGVMREVETGADFMPDLDRLAAAIHSRTKAIIVNSPNNPAGVVYPAEVFERLQNLLARLGSGALVVSDEPYDAVVFDGLKLPAAPSIVERCVTAYSWSKSQALSGERIGYLALSPRIAEWAPLRDACTFANRTLGYINAPAIWQLVVAETGECKLSAAVYQEKRDLFCDALSKMGYEVAKPRGTFYLFPKSPVPDDVAFIRTLLKEGILAVPGSGFGRGGYFRLTLTAPRDTIVRSFAGFERAFRAVRGIETTS